MDLQNFPRATHMTNKWPQSNKLFSLRNETSCTKITRGFPFLGCKKQSLHFSLCGQLLCIICFEAKLSPLEQFVVYPLTTFFGRSSNFSFDVQSQLLDLISFRDAHFTVDVWAIVCATNWMHKWNMLARSFPLLQGWQSKVAQDLGPVSKHGARRAPWWFQP